MYQFYVVTNADPQRPGLAYKIELPPHAGQDWYEESLVLKAQRHTNYANSGHRTDANTVITVIRPDGSMETQPHTLTWSQLTELLRSADYDYNDVYERRQGRPEKKVLVLTTSKDRRTSALTARGGY